MTTISNTPQAAWEAMSELEKIEWLAENIMGWNQRHFADMEARGIVPLRRRLGTPGWNPLTSWDHWRQVEEKIMQDEWLWQCYVTELVPACSVDTDFAMLAYAATDLPTRAKALYLALSDAR